MFKTDINRARSLINKTKLLFKEINSETSLGRIRSLGLQLTGVQLMGYSSNIITQASWRSLFVLVAVVDDKSERMIALQ